MAKLYKNALISNEELLLNQSKLQIENPSKPLEAMPHLDELERENIQKEAYAQGYLCGKKEEHNRKEQELENLKEHLERALTAIPNAVAQNRLDLNSEIADIVLLIIQQFFVENQKNTQHITQQINQILAHLNNKQTVELCMHPQEIAALQNGSIHLEAAHLNSLKIKSDESLTLGGYLIKTNHGIFDASIEKQIDKLKEVLLELKYRGEHVSPA